MNKKLIIILALFLCGTALIFVISKENTFQKTTAVGLIAPDFEITDSLNGSKISSSELKGKVLFINFWASWCQPCREEMPSIEALFKEMQSNDNFRMITIVNNDSIENALEYMKKNGYTFPVYSDPDGITSKNFGITGVPETYIINKNGILTKRVLGAAEWNSSDAKLFISSLLIE